MPIILGGPGAYKVRRHGDITIAFHWINKQPSMVLYPSFRREGVTPFAIPLDCAFDYAEDAHLVEKAAFAADLMGFGHDKSQTLRIARLINDSLPDLIEMPPERETKPHYGGEMKVKIDGETVMHVGD